jgi:uncharacterized protein
MYYDMRKALNVMCHFRMSHLVTIIMFVLASASISCGQKLKTRENRTRDSLIELMGDSTFAIISLRDAALRDVFGKPAQWDAGEFVATAKTLHIPPKPLGWTTDYEGVFTQSQIDTLNAMIALFEKETTREIAVVTIDSGWTTKARFDSSVAALGSKWGIGKERVNNGVLIGLSVNLRRIYISNGSGIVPRMSNSETKRIIDDIIIPYFKEANYFEGVRQGVSAIIKKLR